MFVNRHLHAIFSQVTYRPHSPSGLPAGGTSVTMRHNNPGFMVSECDQLFVSERQAACQLEGDKLYNTVQISSTMLSKRPFE
jgi:hypothetical protein